MERQLTVKPSRQLRQLCWASYALVMLALVCWDWHWSSLAWQLPIALTLLYPLLQRLNAVEPLVQLQWGDGHWHHGHTGEQLSAHSRVAAHMIWCAWDLSGRSRYQLLWHDQFEPAQWRTLCRQVQLQQWQSLTR